MMIYIILDDEDFTEPKKPIYNTGRLSYASSGYSSMVRGKTSPMIHPRIHLEGKKRHINLYFERFHGGSKYENNWN